MKLNLSESQINNKLLAYHYTDDDFITGSVLQAENKNVFRANTQTEKDLEEARKKHNPTAPNRSTCFYTSPYQKNRFARMGKNCFLVEVLGESFYSDSNIIDEISELNYKITESFKHGRSVKNLTEEKDILSKQYWQSKINERKNVEILSDSIKIIRKIH
jgi:hypothetical protein